MSQGFLIFMLIIAAFFFLVFVYFILFSRPTGGQAEKEIREAEEKLKDENFSHFQLLQGYFRRYLDSNIGQNRFIFVLTLLFILGGFVMIGYGILIHEFSTTNITAQPWPAIIAGLITEFIAATILIVFQAVSRQTETYFKVLERMTVIGASLRVLDDIGNDPTDDQRLKINAKIRAIELLLGSQSPTNEQKNKSDS